MVKTFSPKTELPKITDERIDLLEKLSNASGVSGDEGAIRRIIREEIAAAADELRTDVLGNLIAVKKAKKAARRASWSPRIWTKSDSC